MASGLGQYSDLPEGAQVVYSDLPAGAQLASAPSPYSEASMDAHPPVAPQPGIPRSPSEMIGEGEEAQARGQAGLGAQYIHSGPMEMVRGAGDIAQGNVAHGIHRAVTGAGVAAIPAVASTLPIAAIEAPVGTALGLIGGGTGGAVGKYGGRAIGLSPDQADVAGDVLGAVGGGVGAKGGGVVDSLLDRFRYERPTSISLPWGLGKIRDVGPTDVPGGYPGDLPSTQEFQNNQLKTAIQEGRAAKLPVRLPRSLPEVDPVAQAVRERRAAWLPTKIDTGKSGTALGRISSSEAELSPDDLISRTRKITIPGDEPTAIDLKRAGDLTQAPLERLKTLAKFGDRLAQNELNRRLKN